MFIAGKARWDEQLKGLIELERRCLTPREEVELSSESQEVLTDLMVSEEDMQKTAPEDFQRQISRSRGQKKLWRSYKRSTS